VQNLLDFKLLEDLLLNTQYLTNRDNDLINHFKPSTNMQVVTYKA